MGLKFINKDEAYAPNLRDKRVVKRISAVLAWCDGNLFEDSVVHLRSVDDPKLPLLKGKSLAAAFGQPQHPLSKWLRHRLLIQVGAYEPGRLSYGYKLRHGAVEQLRALIGEEHVPVLSDSQTYDQKFAAELASGEFKYTEKSDRLWHPLQNMPRAHKDKFWSNYLPYDYDISACAPNLLAQTAKLVGLSEDKLAGVQKYLDEKNSFRQHVAELTGMNANQTKGVINSLFNGARLVPHRRCATFEALGFDRAALERLKADEQVTALRESIKEIWETLSGINQGKKGSKWQIYFRLERQVIDVVHQYLRDHDNKFFSEHDGWRCAKPVDTAELSALVLERTEYLLKFDKN